MKKYIFVSDLQVPSHDQRAVDTVCEFIADWQPDVLCNVGDDTDSPEPARWSKGMAAEYAGTLQKGLDETRRVHAQFREALGPDKPYHVQASNHGTRVETYVRKYAPALAPLRSLSIESLLGYEDLGITYHRQLFEFEPGWVLAHGHEGSLSPTPGGTAMSLARKLGKSVIIGHTHRLGAQHETRGLNGKTQTIWGYEVGHLMDIRKAHYLSTGSANWCQGFVTLQVQDRQVYPSMHAFGRNGKLVAHGGSYG